MTPSAPRTTKHSSEQTRSHKSTDDTKAAPKDTKSREPEMLRADMQQAQFNFTRIAEDTHSRAMHRSSEAYQACLETISAVQSDLYHKGADAFQAYSAAMTAALAPSEVSKQCDDAYQNYATAVQELFDTSEPRSKSEEADAAYLKAVADAQGQPDAEARLAGAYITYLEAVQNAWDKSAERREANSALQTWLDLLKQAQGQYQEQTFEAYRSYVEGLRKAPVETDAVQRSEKAHDAYSKSLQEIWGSARESLGNAAASTILESLQRAWTSK